MRKWLCRLRPSSKRVNRCLPTVTTSTTVRPGEVVLDEPGMAQLAAHEPLPGERGVQPLAGQVDGVALGHAPDRSGRARRRTRPSRRAGSSFHPDGELSLDEVADGYVDLIVGRMLGGRERKWSL